MRKMILYLMHVDWDWIKQRPHFLAEQLSRRYEVAVAYPLARQRQRMTRNTRDGLRLKPMATLPFKREVPAVYGMNRALLRLYCSSLIRRLKPEYVWITHPAMYEYVLDGFAGKLIYDCMDDAVAFDTTRDFFLSRMLDLEKKLIERASVVFTSSQRLADTLDKRMPCADKTVLVRNAFGGSMIEPLEERSRCDADGGWTVGYVGTVAPWIDFRAMSHCLDRFDDLRFKIIGPVDVDVRPWQRDRMEFVGPIKHSDLYGSVRDCDCLIMPFRLNELVLSVDPVKLYEYVNFGKPIVCTRYPEVERFAPFVSFYNGKDALAQTIGELRESGFARKYSDDDRTAFLRENCWDSRGRQIVTSLEKLHG